MPIAVSFETRPAPKEWRLEIWLREPFLQIPKMNHGSLPRKLWKKILSIFTLPCQPAIQDDGRRISFWLYLTMDDLTGIA